jgi:hypothetical protein
MFDILDRIRTTTPADLEGVRADFDDLPRGHFKAAKRTGMTRIVEGADDLVAPARGNGGGGNSRPVIPVLSDDVAHNGEYCDNPRCCPEAGPVDLRSPAQINFMARLMDELAGLDAKLAEDAAAYTTGMTLNGRWTRNEGQVKGTISTWIDRLKAKITELKAAQLPEGHPIIIDAPPALADGRYAVELDGELRFYHLETGKPGGNWAGVRFLKRKSTDNLWPIRNDAEKTRIMQAIIDAGPEAAEITYAVTLKSCRRCHRDLTDQKNPYLAMGLGPDCGEKM